MNDKKWFVLPGMKSAFLRYLSIVYDYLSSSPKINETPILLVGDSGVSKSLFIEIAKQFFVTSKKIKLNEDGFSDKVKRLNCASFSKELAESEIFGHVKGAYTGATSNKAGIVEIADGGLLILDEIGELNEEIQAKLLIFIEDGEYRRLGSPDVKKASLKIIGTTNKRSGYRTDFWFRFYPIFLPALHERRLDVLYYIAIKYPDIFKRLTPQHALSLMAHDWPGNTREIDRVVSIIMSEDKLYDIRYAKNDDKGNAPLFFPLDQRQTSLANMYLSDFCRDLIESGFDVSLFNSIIAAFGLQVPYSFSTVDELLKIKKAFKDSEFFQKIIDGPSEALFSKSKNKNDRISLCIIETRVQSGRDFFKKNDYTFKDYIKMFESETDMLTTYNLLLALQNQLNTEGNFYANFAYKVDDLLKKIDGLDGIFWVDEDKRLEDIGACFSAICNIFLKDKNSDKNVFSMEDIYSGEYWDYTKTERLLMDSFNKVGFIETALHFRIGTKAIINYKYKIGERWSEYVKKVLGDNDLTEVEGAECVKAKGNNDLTQYTEKQLLLAYYGLLLNKYRKDRDVFKHADVPESTCRHKLERLGLLPRKKER